MNGQESPRSVGWETVHIFVSSTFNDMHAERDCLVKEVFPELRDWCEERKLRLVDIDLRWGVTETNATRNKNVVQVCLDRIDKARPFFVCFLGQRYGWVPTDQEIAPGTFKDFAGLGKAVEKNASVTEMEVLHALLADPFDQGAGARMPAEHAFFYLRDPGYLAQVPADLLPLRRTYTDEAEPDEQSRAFLLSKQADLRKIVSEKTNRPALPYRGRWNPEARTPELALPLLCPSSDKKNRERWRKQWNDWAGVATTDEAVVAADQDKARAFNDRLCAGRLEDFGSEGRTLGAVILEDLREAILARYPERKDPPKQDDLEQEIDRHEDFVRTATDVFIERSGDFAELDAYAAGDSQSLFVLVAEAGLGKSTLLANWVARWRSREGKPTGETAHARFVGVGERSSTVDALLRSILEELRRAGKLASEIPDNANLLRSKFAELLGECGKKGRIVVVLDALNQLQSGLADLDWLTRALPESVKLIVSCKLGDQQGDALATEMRADERVYVSKVQPFTDLQHRRDLVAAYLQQYLKELDEQHLEALIRAEGADNPLFLKIVLTELRVFGAFARLGEVIKHEFGTTPQTAFDAVLRRLENDPSTTAVPSKQAVPLLFGLLAHSRGGLPEDLLVRMFLDELGFSGDFSDAMRATIRLLLRQVRPFLARRDGRTDFFYEAFQLAAQNRCTTASGPLAREAGEGQGEGPNAHSPDHQAEDLDRPLTIWQGLFARLRGRQPKGKGLIEPSANIPPGARAQAVTEWHGRLARACEGWTALDGASKRYALGNLVHHEVEAGNGAAAAEGMADFAYHYERLRALGRNDVANVVVDFMVTETAVGLAHTLRERLGLWKTFHTEHAHRFQREVHDLAPETYLLQLAVAHADTSPVTRSAEDWLESTGSATTWLRLTRRLHKVERRPCLRTFEGHTSQVTDVAPLPDGRKAVSGSYDGTLKLWNLETGQCLRTFDGHAKGVLAVAVLPNGRCAISGGMDNSLKQWDLQTGQCLRTFDGHKHRVTAVAPLSDGQRAISGSYDGTLKLWKLQTGQCLCTFEGHTGVVVAVAVLPNGRQAVSGSQDATLKLWDLQTGRCLRTFEARKFPVQDVAVLPDGRRAISGGQDFTLSLWDLDNGECLRSLKGHTESVDSVAVLRDGRRAISTSLDQTLKLWDLQNGRCLRTFEWPTASGRAVAVVPDNRRVLWASTKGLKLWDLEAEEHPGALERHKDRVAAVALLRDSRRVISGSSEGTLKLWDLQTGQCLRTLERHTLDVFAEGTCQYPIADMEVLPDGRRVILRSTIVSVLQLWDMQAGQRLAKFQGHTSDVTSVAPLPDGRRVISGSNDSTLKLWDLETGQCLRTIKGHTGEIYAVAVLPDGHRAISGGRDCTLKLWNVETGECLHTFQGHVKHVQKIAVLPDGRRAISTSGDETLKLWNLETGECLATFQLHTGYLRAMALLSDGNRVIAACGNTLKLWDLQTGGCQSTFEGHEAEVFTLALLPDGSRVISGSSDCTLKLWNLQTGLCLATWQTETVIWCCTATSEVIVAGTEGGEVLFLKLMPPGRITPDTTASTWHPSRPLLALARANGTILVQAWHPASQYLEELGRCPGPPVERLQWSCDGAHLRVVTRDGTTRVLDATILHEAPAPACPWADPRDLSPDNQWRAVIRDGRLDLIPVSKEAPP